MADVPTAVMRKRVLEIADILDRWGHAEIAAELRFLVTGNKRAKYHRKRDPHHKPNWNTNKVVRQVHVFLSMGMPYQQILLLVPEVPNIGRISDIKKGKIVGNGL